MEKQEWYCYKCRSYVDSKSVTYEETHDLCGAIVNIKAQELAKEFYKGIDLVEQGIDLVPAFREGFIQGYSFNKNILFFTNDKNMKISYDDGNIVIDHNNETGEFTFNRIRFRGDQGEILKPHYK